MKQAADQAKGQQPKGPEAQRQEDGQKAGIEFAVRGRPVTSAPGLDVEVMVELGAGVQIGIGVGFTAHEQLHQDRAQAENQCREVKDTHALMVAQRRAPRALQNALATKTSCFSRQLG